MLLRIFSLSLSELCLRSSLYSLWNPLCSLLGILVGFCLKYSLYFVLNPLQISWRIFCEFCAESSLNSAQNWILFRIISRSESFLDSIRNTLYNIFSILSVSFQNVLQDYLKKNSVSVQNPFSNLSSLGSVKNLQNPKGVLFKALFGYSSEFPLDSVRNPLWILFKILSEFY